MKVHNQQRYEVTVGDHRRLEFIGGMEDADVFWLPDRMRILVKFSSRLHDSYYCSLINGEPGMWTRGERAVRGLTQEQRDLALAMCKCFAQENRPPEWD
jgi:hypothetical protein